MADRNSEFRRIVTSHLRGQKANFAVAFLCTLMLSGVDLLRPWILKVIVDNILLSHPLPAFFSGLSETFEHQKTLSVILVASMVIVISLVKGGSTYTQVFLTSRIGFQLAHKLRSELFTHLQRLSLSFHKRAETGELLTKVTTDTNNLREVFSEFALNFASEGLTLVGMIVIMFLVDWRLSFIAISIFPPLALISRYRFHSIRESARRQRSAEGKIASRLHEVLGSILVVQAFGRERYEEERFELQSEKTLDESIRTARLEVASSRAVDIVNAFGLFAVLVFGALQALAGEISPGSVLVFAAYVSGMNAPIRSLAKLSAKISRAMESAARVGDILQIQPEIKDRPGAISVSDIEGEIELRNVSFHYGDQNPILDDVSFTIPTGKTVALLGMSGAGKSTIISLILRFYDPTKGSILIDGTDIRDYKSESIRGHIGLVLQDTILFGSTVRENIAYGKENATEDEIILAAKAANAHEFITKLNNGYDTVLGGRGGTLSGGQRQRIAIARAFVRNSPLLILDEPMTGLDVENEKALYDAMHRLARGKTCLLITHDLQAASNADLIVMLENGQIVGQGTHTELLHHSERYRSLFMEKNKIIGAAQTVN
jgi:ABC-type multidrug transport system fused ATPase/permease subunit